MTNLFDDINNKAKDRIKLTFHRVAYNQGFGHAKILQDKYLPYSSKTMRGFRSAAMSKI